MVALVVLVALVGAGRAADLADSKVWLGATLIHVEFTPSTATDGLSAGLRVDFMIPGQPAAASSLRPGDVLLYLDGKPAPDLDAYERIVRNVDPGTILSAEVIRDHQRVKLSVKFGRRPSDWAKIAIDSRKTCVQDGLQSAAKDADTGAYRAAFTTGTSVFRCAYELRSVDDLSKAVVVLARAAPHLRPVPAIPSEADRHNQRAIVMLGEATGDADLDRTVAEFGAAVYEAPWLPDLHLNYGLALDKAGYAAAAIAALRDYLVLAPDGRDAEKAKQRIAELEVLAEDQKLWSRFVGLVKYGDGSTLTLELRGRKFVVRVGNTVGKNEKARAGDVVLTGTIHGTQFDGKILLRPSAPNDVVGITNPESSLRCFGAEQPYDATGQIEPDGTRLTFKMKWRTFDGNTCLVSSEDWISVPTWFTARASNP
ncbi:MAG TPA: PDZ domain-containing protein [Alphaproteobacteria bacterium]|nr:PDZ domain-containing protein [Alphaproteobacteria bacterium]